MRDRFTFPYVLFYIGMFSMYMYYFADKNHSLKKKRKKVICGGNEKNITVLH